MLIVGRSPGTLVAGATALILVVFFTVMGFAALSAVAHVFPELQADLASQDALVHATVQEAWRAYGEGTWGEALAFRAREWASEVLPSAATLLPVYLGMFLLGAALGKKGWVDAPAQHVRPLRRLAVAGLLGALGLNALEGALLWGAAPFTSSSPRMMVTLGLELLAGPLQALGTVALVLLLARRPAAQRLLAPLAATGRLSLTHYLSHSLLLTPLFSGWGLGLYGRVGSARLVLLALALWTLQVAVSPWWLRHFHLGPAEWLWRSLASGRRLPFRRAEGTAALVGSTDTSGG
jgi:uncharacterized protein